MLKEGVDFELIPYDENDSIVGQWWNIRILRGEFTETVISDIVLGIPESGKAATFNFKVFSSPNEDAVVSNENLQYTVSQILDSIIASEETNLMMSPHG